MKKKIFEYQYHTIHFISYNSEINNLFVFYKNFKANKNCVDIFSGDDLTLIRTLEIQCGDFEIVTDFKYHNRSEEFVICFFDNISIFSKDGILKASLKGENFISTEYYNQNEILVKLGEISGNRSLGLLNIMTNSGKKFRLENIGHYNRDFIIEPTKNLLYGLCNAYENGMFLHILDFSKEYLEIICEEGLYIHRPEIESASIEINSTGDVIYFIANEDSEKNTICIYDIYNQRKPIREIPFESEEIPNLHLLKDRFLVTEYKDKFGIFDLEIIDSIYKRKIFNFYPKESQKCALDKINGKIFFIEENAVKCLQITEEGNIITDERRAKMSDFINKLKNKEFMTAKVGDFYFDDNE